MLLTKEQFEDMPLLVKHAGTRWHFVEDGVGYELPSPTTSEMVSTIPKQYSKARSQCRYSVGQSPSAYLKMLFSALVASGN